MAVTLGTQRLLHLSSNPWYRRINLLSVAAFGQDPWRRRGKGLHVATEETLMLPAPGLYKQRWNVGELFEVGARYKMTRSIETTVS
jgi:hypothetical protein